MTYFYALLRANSWPWTPESGPCSRRHDAQRRRFFQALGHIAAGQEDRDSLVPYLQELGRDTP